MIIVNINFCILILVKKNDGMRKIQNDMKSRGPPPQPPSFNQKSTIPSVIFTIYIFFNILLVHSNIYVLNYIYFLISRVLLNLYQFYHLALATIGRVVSQVLYLIMLLVGDLLRVVMVNQMWHQNHHQLSQPCLPKSRH